MSPVDDPDGPVGGLPAGDDDAPVSATRGEARRDGAPHWLALLAGVAVVLVAWFAISRPSVDSTTADEALSSVPETTIEPTATTGAAEPTEVPSTGPTTADALPSESSPRADLPEASAPLGDLDTEGWRLLVGDGQTVVDVDLDSGIQTRHARIGAPLAIVGGRLLVDRDSRLVWVSRDDLDASPTEIIEVPTLQRMLTRGRPADRPVVVGTGEDAAVWWPNNNADPQTWIKIRLSDGVALDSIALTDAVYGGPEVVATIGSGTFERIDGRWTPVGDLFASSASRQAIVGQRCTQPDSCNWVLQRRGAATPPERLTVPLGGPFDLRLVSDADRILLRHSGGVLVHETGRLVPLLGAAADSVTAVNRLHLLALADGANIGLRSAVVTVVDLDGPPDRSLARIVVDDLVPRWLVLVPPANL